MLKFALIGCGRIAPKHANNLTQNKISNATLSAVCDIKPEKAKAFGEKYKVPYFTDMHEMLRKMSKEIDIISVLTPSGFHAEHALSLVKYGKHLIIEKPMALRLEDADKMISECDKAGIRLFVVKQNRFNLPVLKLKEAIDKNRFGKMVLGTVRVRWCRTADYYKLDSWRGTWALDGGVFANQAIHHIDLLQWFMGPVETVYAKGATRLVNIETEDTGVVVLKFVNGALGIIEATTATRPKDLEGAISILGEKGSVEIGGFAVNEMKVWNFSETLPSDREVLEKCRQMPSDVYGFGHTAYLNSVVDAIINKKSALVDGIEGRKSLELVTSIYESIETGKEVSVNFLPKKCRLGVR